MIEIELFKLFLIVLARFSGLMVSAPILGSPNFPLTAKAGLTALAAILLTPVVPALTTPLPDAPLHFALLATGEFLIGLTIGFIMTLAFAAIQVGGQIMDLQTGFGMMNIFNPSLESQFPIFGFFLFLLAVLFLLATNGHHLMIQALAATYKHIPIGGLTLRPALLWEVTTWGSAMFIDGLMIAAPVAAAMMLAYLTMGLLSRVVSQIHLFVIGFPLTIAIGLLVISFTIPVYMYTLDGLFQHMFQNVDTLIRGMAPGS